MSIVQRHNISRLTWLLGLSLLGTLGCQSMPKLNPFQEKEVASDSVPQSVVALWKDTVLSQPGTQPSRGLGGRIYFYDDSDRPIPVDGKLVVYAYDDSKAEQLNREPDRKYVFDQASLQKYYSESDLGPSYSVWLPWDEAGGPHAEVSLIPMFTTTEGKVVIGEHSRHVLAGKDPADGGTTSQISSESRKLQPKIDSFVSTGSQVDEQRDRMQTEPVGYQEEVQAPREGFRSASIRLPDAVQSRLAKSTDLSDSRLDRRRRMQGGATEGPTPSPASEGPPTSRRNGLSRANSTDTPLTRRKPVEFPPLQSPGQASSANSHAGNLAE